MRRLPKLLAFVCLVCALVCPVFAPGAAISQDTDDSVWPEDAIGMEMSQATLAGFQFQGLQLGTSLDDFKRRFPKAQPADDRLEAKSGLACYTFAGLKSADRAQFYFVDGRLYQIEVEYGPRRIEKSGGMEAMVRKIVAAFGKADNVYRNRRTWHQQNVSRRADFYTLRGGAQLVVTDTSLQRVVDERQKRTALEADARLDFPN